MEINKKILKIQEEYVLEDWSDAQINLEICEKVWKEAQKELLLELGDWQNKNPNEDLMDYITTKGLSLN